MNQNAVQWFERPERPRLAYRSTPGSGPGVLFLGGLASDMTGTKASALEEAAIARGRAFLRFDYRGHGRSDGRFIDGAISDWFEDALDVFDKLTTGPQIVIGSSMGGWLALLLATARSHRIKALVGIAAAPDFTERLIWDTLTAPARETLLRDGVLYQPSAWGDPMPITRRLVEDGRRCLILDEPIPFDGPVRLLHGQNDTDVPWTLSLTIAERLETADVRVTLIKDGDHRLSRPEDIALLIDAVDALAL